MNIYLSIIKSLLLVFISTAALQIGGAGQFAMKTSLKMYEITAGALSSRSSQKRFSLVPEKHSMFLDR